MMISCLVGVFTRAGRRGLDRRGKAAPRGDEVRKKRLFVDLTRPADVTASLKRVELSDTVSVWNFGSNGSYDLLV